MRMRTPLSPKMPKENRNMKKPTCSHRLRQKSTAVEWKLIFQAAWKWLRYHLRLRPHHRLIRPSTVIVTKMMTYIFLQHLPQKFVHQVSPTKKSSIFLPKMLSNDAYADAVELTKFALASLEARDAELSAEYLERALKLINKR
mmetsp:Transcript_13924/g.30580  ORF Transcript_13924/g.30580 Transcript_13924/m.30580 type:complete len:143 (-) Transcript_13924:94-522(-)